MMNHIKSDWNAIIFLIICFIAIFLWTYIDTVEFNERYQYKQTYQSLKKQVYADIEASRPEFIPALAEMINLQQKHQLFYERDFLATLKDFNVFFKKKPRPDQGILYEGFLKLLSQKHVYTEEQSKLDLNLKRIWLAQFNRPDALQVEGEFKHLRQQIKASTLDAWEKLDWQLFSYQEQAGLYGFIRADENYIETTYSRALSKINPSREHIQAVEKLLPRFAQLHAHFADFLAAQDNYNYAKVNYDQSLYYLKHQDYPEKNKSNARFTRAQVLKRYAQLEYKHYRHADFYLQKTALQLARDSLEEANHINVQVKTRQDELQNWRKTLAQWLEQSEDNIPALLQGFQQKGINKASYLQHLPLSQQAFQTILPKKGAVDYERYLSSQAIYPYLWKHQPEVDSLCGPYYALNQKLFKNFVDNHLAKKTYAKKMQAQLKHLQKQTPDYQLVSLQYYQQERLGKWFVLLQSLGFQALLPLSADPIQVQAQQAALRLQIQEKALSKSILSQLYHTLFQPVDLYLQQLQDDDRPTLLLFNIANSHLKQLPFAALYDGKQYLIEKYPLSYIDDFAQLQQMTSSQSTLEPQLLAYSHDQSRHIDKDSFKRLFALSGEIEEIVRNWSNGKHQPNSVWLQNQPFVQLQQQLAQQPVQILHLAGHFRLTKDLKPSFFVFSDAAQQGKKVYLTDVLALPLQEIELLSLSVCDGATPDSQDMAADKLFRDQGVKATLASTWGLNDESAAELMPRFYHALKYGENKAVALQTAQRAFIDKQLYRGNCDPARQIERKVYAPDLVARRACAYFEQPYYWAGFRVTGDFRALVGNDIN